MPTANCTRCHEPIPDSAERWPDGDGVICQECWERESGDLWWQLAVPFAAAIQEGNESE